MGAGSIFILAVAITTVISPNLTDPVLLPKFLLLLVVTLPLFIYTFKANELKRFNLGRLASRDFLRNNTILVFATLFLLIHALSTVVSQSPTTAVFGVSGRRNGFLTYLAFFLLFLMARRFANKESLNGFFFALSCVGAFEAMYMLIQKIGLDPAPWSFVYANTMIGTLGNPDFASAFVALSTPATGYLIYLNIRDKKKVAMFFGLFLTQITALLVSKVYQGPMALAIAGFVACASLVWFTKKGLQYRLVVVSTVLLSGLVAILGVLGKGPLASIFAKRSFQVRIDAYWDTAAEMGLRHLFFGVGPEQFADQFNRFYSLENRKVFGSLVTDNAHNYFLQFFAEIGIFGAFFFLLLSLTTFAKAFRNLSHANKSDLALKIAVIATLTVYFAQALISIEHIAINVWFWILLGLLSGKTISAESIQELPKSLGKNQRTRSKTKVTKSQTSSLNGVIATATGIFLLTISLLIYNLDNKVWKIEQSFKNQQGSDLTQEDLSSLTNATQGWPFDAQLATRASSLLLTFGQGAGLETLKRAIRMSPESSPALALLASYNEQKVNRGFGIEAREKLLILQPHDEANFVELIRDYLFINEPAKAEELQGKLRTFALPATITSTDLIIKEYYSGQAG
jgi:O-antigen ligase